MERMLLKKVGGVSMWEGTVLIGVKEGRETLRDKDKQQDKRTVD